MALATLAKWTEKSLVGFVTLVECSLGVANLSAKTLGEVTFTLNLVVPIILPLDIV